MSIDPAIARSLTDAGIGAVFHEKELSDYGKLGLGYQAWLKTHGPDLKRDGGLVVFRGKGQRDMMRMVAKSFHMNGAGVRIVSLSGFISIYKARNDKTDDLLDAPTLMISAAQAGGRGCPLAWWDMEFMQDHIQTRVDSRKIVLLHWAHDRPLEERDPMYQWWDEGFIEWINERGRILTVANVEALA